MDKDFGTIIDNAKSLADKCLAIKDSKYFVYDVFLQHFTSDINSLLKSLKSQDQDPVDRRKRLIDALAHELSLSTKHLENLYNSISDDIKAPCKGATARSRAVVNSSGSLPESLSTAFSQLDDQLPSDFVLYHQTITEHLFSSPICSNESDLVSVNADILNEFIANYAQILASRSGSVSSGSVSDTPTLVWEPILTDKICHPEGDSSNQIDLI